jgi:Uma2 family endonuclease
MSAHITRRLFNFDQYFRMAETGILSPAERVELIRGEIVLMSPIGPRHNASVNDAIQAFVLQLHGRAIVHCQSTVVLDAFAAPEPDIVLLKLRDDRYATKHAGAPDMFLIVEVADSSLEYDTTAKLNLYAILGVPEYWVADLRNNRVMVYSEPEGDTYKFVQEFHRGDVIAPSAFPDCRIPVDLFLPQFRKS